jgi:hypothetical protein
MYIRRNQAQDWQRNIYYNQGSGLIALKIIKISALKSV